jgi:hypothetical protein
MVEMIALSRLASLAASAASSSSCRALVSAETPLSVLLQQRELSEVEVPIGVQTNPMHHNNQQHTTNWHQGSAQPVAEAVEEEEPEGKKSNKKKKKELFKKAVRKRQDLPNIEKILALEQTPEYEGGRRRTSSATTETSVKCAVERRNERERTRYIVIVSLDKILITHKSLKK